MLHCYRNSILFHFHALQKQVKMFWKIFKTWNTLSARWESGFMVSLHSNLTLQARKPQYFHWVSASLLPSILVKHLGLKNTFQSKILLFICFRFSLNSEQTDISWHQCHYDTTICRNPNNRDKKLFRGGSFCSHSQFAPSICSPEVPCLSVWVALMSRQAGGIMCSQSICKVFVNHIFCYLILLAKPRGLTALNLSLGLR